MNAVMTIRATHNAGECVECDALRRALENVTTETCARFTHGSACVAFAEHDE
jgi:hypothetical protein